MDRITFAIDWVTNRGVNGALLLTLFALLNFLALMGSVWALLVIIYENTNITTDISDFEVVSVASLVIYLSTNGILMEVLPNTHGRVAQLTVIQIMMQISYPVVLVGAIVFMYIGCGIAAGIERINDSKNEKHKVIKNSLVAVTNSTYNYTIEPIEEESIDINKVRPQELNSIQFRNDYEW